jgi:DNA-binding PadR family transcriptional regulator
MPHFKDQALIPQQAVRLCALGLLAEEERKFGELSTEVRRFVSRMLGPSLDILGTSIEGLRYEGLLEGVGPRAAPGQSLTADSVVRLTKAGRERLRELLKSRVRAPLTDLSKLVIALKLRFMDLLTAAERAEEFDRLAAATEQEIARLSDLAAQDGGGPFVDWLRQDIEQAEQRLAWYRERAAGGAG